ILRPKYPRGVGGYPHHHPYCSTRRSSSSFLSGGRKLASTEFAASSRICSSENSNRSCTSTYSSSRLLPNIGGSSELIVTINPDSKYIFTGCSSKLLQHPVRMLLVTFSSSGICFSASTSSNSASFRAERACPT